jgi:hypothetical protein
MHKFQQESNLTSKWRVNIGDVVTRLLHSLWIPDTRSSYVILFAAFKAFAWTYSRQNTLYKSLVYSYSKSKIVSLLLFSSNEASHTLRIFQRWRQFKFNIELQSHIYPNDCWCFHLPNYHGLFSFYQCYLQSRTWHWGSFLFLMVPFLSLYTPTSVSPYVPPLPLLPLSSCNSGPLTGWNVPSFFPGTSLVPIRLGYDVVDLDLHLRLSLAPPIFYGISGRRVEIDAPISTV